MKLKYSTLLYTKVILICSLTVVFILPFHIVLAVADQGSEVEQANHFVVFGPNDYARDKGKPKTITDTFSILNPSKSYAIRIYNSGSEGQYEKMVSSAIITLNDNPVIRTKDFNGNVPFIEREIVLIENNQLKVELRSAPGSGLTIEIVAYNAPPVAIDDSAITDEDTPVTIDVLANDSDIDGDSLTVTSATDPFHGMVVINPDNTITYTSDVNYNGGDFFSYTADDAYGGVDTAIVTVSIAPVNDSPPVAEDDTATTNEGTPVTIDVLANDSDADLDPLTVTSATDPAHGMVVINPDNTITYTPYHGDDAFNYTIDDGFGGVDTATVSVTVYIATIDVTPPTLNITSPLPNKNLVSVFAVKSPIIITGNVTDFASGIDSVTCNENPVALYDSSFSIEVDIDIGLNEFEIRAVDKAGNIASTIITVDYDDVEFLVDNYGPILRFNPYESFFPDSVDAVLRESEFQWGHIENEYNYDLFDLELHGSIPLGELDDPTDLEAAMAMVDPGLKSWIHIQDELKPGNIERAKSYIRLNRWFGTNVLELQFWYFYPYNGPGQFRISFLGLQDLYVFLPDSEEGIGKHYGDWECVTLRFSRNTLLPEPFTYMLQSVGISAHGQIKVFPVAMLHNIYSHPIIYVAHESHAHYETAWPYNEDYSQFYYEELFDYGIAWGHIFDMITYIPPYSLEFISGGENHQIISAEITRYGIDSFGNLVAEWAAGAYDIQEPKWLSYQGRWGQYEKLSYSFPLSIYVSGTSVYTQTEVGGGPTGPKMKPEWLVGWPY